MVTLSTNSFTMAQAVSLILLFLVSLTMSQSIEPSNSTLQSQVDQLELILATGGMFPVAPLTSEIGLGGTQTALNSIKISGTIRVADPSSQNSVGKGDIAYISCDPNSGTSNISPSQVFDNVSNIQPQAIVLYSLTGSHCNVTGVAGYTSILTMTNMGDASNVLQSLGGSAPSATIMDSTNAHASNAGSSSPTSTNTVQTQSTPSTAVAMSILYSITGIITVLFLVIIATGAYRAHRHPERYGPRNIPGRPRQSRAKGLARAMLETLPIVKFGDPDPPKPGAPSEIELEEGRRTGQETPAAVVEENASKNDSETSSENEVAKATPAVMEDQPSASTEAVVESGMNPHTNAPATPEDEAASNNLGCSICTEDFHLGEDVRVLPCNHKYHPACIDPWLLNVSGTCPLCRIDLRPTPTNDPNSPTSPTADAANPDAPLPPPLEAENGEQDANRGTRGSRILDLAHLRHAPAQERIAALRQLRSEQRENQSEAIGPAIADVTVADSGRRARLSGRLRDVFRIRTRTESAPEEVERAAAAASSAAEDPATSSAATGRN